MNIIDMAMATFGIDAIVTLKGLWVILGTAISLLIMFLIISYYFYFPTKDFLRLKHNHIQGEIDSAETKNLDAKDNFDKSELTIKDAETKKHIIISRGQKEASEIKENIVEGAKKEAKIIYDDAVSIASREAKGIKSSAEEEIAQIAIMAAEKIISKELDNDTNKKLVEELIEELR